MTLIDEGFAKKYRLSNRTEIKNALIYGKSLKIGSWRIKYLANSLSHSRLLVAIKKTTCNSPQRNRVKRLLRESYRKNQLIKNCGYDIVVRCNHFKKYKLSEIDQLWITLLKRIKT